MASSKALAKPGPHPPPSPALAKAKLPLRSVSAPWWRVHPAKFGPLFFGKTGDNRFDSPAGAFGVLYLARAPRGAFIETFGQASGVRVLDEDELAARSLCRVRTRRPLRLVDLTSTGLARLGADARLLSGDYLAAQAWSHALHDHRAKPDGIAYRARHDPSQTCAAIFERAASVVVADSPVPLLDPKLTALLIDLLGAYDYGLA